MIKELEATKITARLICDYACALNELREHNNVMYKGNEMSDALTKAGAPKSFIEFIPSFGTTKRKLATIAKLSADKSVEWSAVYPGDRHAKKFIKECMLKFTEDLLNKVRELLS